ncbi:hypothetical protein M9458_036200, partial [Cirrhinus mrigala]
FWTRSRTTTSPTITSTCRLTSRKSSSSPQQTPRPPSPLPYWTEWRSSRCQ